MPDCDQSLRSLNHCDRSEKCSETAGLLRSLRLLKNRSEIVVIIGNSMPRMEKLKCFKATGDTHGQFCKTWCCSLIANSMLKLEERMNKSYNLAVLKQFLLCWTEFPCPFLNNRIYAPRFATSLSKLH